MFVFIAGFLKQRKLLPWQNWPFQKNKHQILFKGWYLKIVAILFIRKIMI